MTTEVVPHRELLERVASRLAQTTAATDHLMLTRWRVLSLCQYLLGDPAADLSQTCRAALESFAVHGADAATSKSIEVAAGLVKRDQGGMQGVLPSIAGAKRRAVDAHLSALVGEGPRTIDRALDVLPRVQERMKPSVLGLPLPGLRHRLDIAASVLADRGRCQKSRIKVAAAVLYVDELHDAIPDALGVIGLLDDDYALRVVLQEIALEEKDVETGGALLHWSERISSIWNDLPFLQGVNLKREECPIPVTWLDRLMSYVSYEHVLGADKAPLLLLQPSVACSPLHTIVSLIGLLVLDALTSSQKKAQALRIGSTYEIDGLFVRFEGPAGPPTPGWLRLRFRDGFLHRPPDLADRMVPVDNRRLSSSRDFCSPSRMPGAEPIQRFFGWDAAIGPTSIASHLVLVTSHRGALTLLGGVQSNGICVLEHGLVKFVGAAGEDVDSHGALVLIAPSLSAVRLLLDRGVRAQAIFIDGYERLNRGRCELPFLTNNDAPPFIAWAPTGYYPASPPTWLPAHKRLTVSSDDLRSIIEVDDRDSQAQHPSLVEAAKGASVQTRDCAAATPEELSLAAAIDDYSSMLREARGLPDYWRFHLASVARTLRLLVTATPAAWSAVQPIAAAWSETIEDRWATFRSAARAALDPIRAAERQLVQAVARMPGAVNSRAEALRTFLAEVPGNPLWRLVCDRPEQVQVAAVLIRELRLGAVEPILVRELAVCSTCVVAGWTGTSFARRLWAHTPSSLVALVDAADRERWQRAAMASRQQIQGQSILSVVADRPPAAAPVCASEPPPSPVFDESDVGGLVECAFLWLVGEEDARVLARTSRVVVEEANTVHERPAARLQPDDRVILGSGTGRWSPADELTEAVVAAVQTSHPDLVRRAREWRSALRRLCDTEDLQIGQFRARLASLGIRREAQTLAGWLDIDRGSPISPRGAAAELEVLWPLVRKHAGCALEEVILACTRLRSLRVAASRALLQLWKGQTVDLGVDESRLDDLVERLRREVHVYEVERVALGRVPAAMLGWRISPELAARFQSDHSADTPALESADEEGE